MDLLSMDMGNASRSRTPNPLGSVAEPGLCFDVLDLQAAVAASVRVVIASCASPDESQISSVTTSH
jgi:hypothetical protein